jgi:hypothetical protein
MVFRLGNKEGSRNTQFAIARAVGGWSDYFLLDDEVFANVLPKPFIPTVPYSTLYTFMLLPAFTETSVVNLALASGLLAHALDVEPAYAPSVPATGQSVFSFPVRPHSKLDANWLHQRGQVEIDALFVARRRSKDTLFLVEAKCGSQFGSLAKHKICYALAAVRTRLPENVDVCPIYLRVVKQSSQLNFWIAECSFPIRGAQAFSIDEIRITNVSALSLVGINIWH